MFRYIRKRNIHRSFREAFGESERPSGDIGAALRGRSEKQEAAKRELFEFIEKDLFLRAVLHARGASRQDLEYLFQYLLLNFPIWNWRESKFFPGAALLSPRRLRYLLDAWLSSRRFAEQVKSGANPSPPRESLQDAAVRSLDRLWRWE